MICLYLSSFENSCLMHLKCIFKPFETFLLPVPFCYQFTFVAELKATKRPAAWSLPLAVPASANFLLSGERMYVLNEWLCSLEVRLLCCF